MDLQKFYPWNWFKHEQAHAAEAEQIPVKRSAGEAGMPGFERAHPRTQFHQQVDRLFDDMFRGFGLPSPGSRFAEPALWSGDGAFRPSLNVSSDGAGYQVTLEAPGMTEADLSIEVRGDALTIKGQKREEKETKDRHFYRIERRYGAFQRTLTLPEDADADDIRAHMKDGVLSLSIPRREIADSRVKNITINR